MRHTQSPCRFRESNKEMTQQKNSYQHSCNGKHPKVIAKQQYGKASRDTDRYQKRRDTRIRHQSVPRHRGAYAFTDLVSPEKITVQRIVQEERPIFGEYESISTAKYD